MRRVLVVLVLLAVACRRQGTGGSGLTGSIEMDGSSTVFPISEAIAEEFLVEEPGVRVKVGQSGTGGGFKKFCNGETVISDASRLIGDDERRACVASGVEFVELKVAIDGLSVVTHQSTKFLNCLTVSELKSAWSPGSGVKTWRDLKPQWPAKEIKFYSPGADSGTFDYFTKAVVGEEGALRSGPEVTTSEDDNVLVQGVANDRDSLGYFGYAYYKENKNKLKAVKVDGGSGCISPSDKTIEDGTYKPLSRPLYIYVSTEALDEKHVKTFVDFYLETAGEIVADVGYIALPKADLAAARSALERAAA